VRSDLGGGLVAHEAPGLSIVIPAYNEAHRILPYLERIEAYCSRQDESFEVLVVDDGSRDGTAELVRQWGATRPWLRLIRHEDNRGKGHVVRTGMLAARGALRLMADADGATPIEELERLRARLSSERRAVAVGSRAVPDPDVHRVFKRHRQLIGAVFSAIKGFMVGVRVADSQCGFKLFTAAAAETLFGASRVDRFAFDVEILYLAGKAGIPVAEVAINWHDVDRSRVRLVADSLQMARDVWRIRRLHRTTLLEPACEVNSPVAAVAAAD
jgi:dolichyl-phosphate beta-glucosyltransferase